MMKKKKLNLPQLTLNKAVISNLSQDRITGGASSPRITCFETCVQTCLETCQFGCSVSEVSQMGTSCAGCNTTMICP
ncbi:hypothetical protein [Chitinophaga qingshengii]|uniref:Six-cysteine peptide SCIFF n=1 Tax=Chitinophaga qingshengii TaxID=1569794 RepID=A0ABR7TU11_9BACT|nr:hypothetical protein [Chitinophaga qingshengii]MBC9933525.1 hypothetical protein [Chitinophaga qingshengii]